MSGPQLFSESANRERSRADGREKESFDSSGHISQTLQCLHLEFYATSATPTPVEGICAEVLDLSVATLQSFQVIQYSAIRDDFGPIHNKPVRSFRPAFE